jgi:flagella basal body P-ring formation protein FlgA
MIGKATYRKIRSVQQLRKDANLYKKVLRVAQFESEVDMGVNPKNSDQADVSALTEADFGYIGKVCLLVEKRLNNSKWVIKTVDEIENKFKAKPSISRGIRYNDELFKANRGILEEHLHELENH